MKSYNRKPIPYSTIVAVVNGDPVAVDEVLNYYRGVIRSKSIRAFKDEYGNESYSVDESAVAQIEAKLIEKIIVKFKPF